MRKILSKLLICILITLIISNACMTNVAHASVLEAFTKGVNAAWGVVVEFIEDILGTVVGIFAIIPKIIVLPLALSTQSFMASIAYSQGVSDADGNIKNATVFNPDTWFLSPFDIIFNKVALVDVNIFNIPTQAGAIKSIRTAAASWYYVMRIIASAILLCILVYVGIRMAISTVASDKAAYKKMLTDWAVSLALIFLMQYIIVFTFAVNTAFVKSLESISRAEGVSNAILKLYLSAVMLDIDSIAATIVICMLTWQTVSLLISYISRMLKVTFLVIISPLITLTYSIDKMGDGKAQALNTWLKEFIYTVLLQPFHCVIYVAFIGVAMEILGRAVPLFEFDNNNIGTAVLCILCIHFTKEAEKILGKIFNFADSTSGTSLATGMIATAAIANNAKNIGKGARKVVNSAKNIKTLAPEAIKNARVTAGAMSLLMSGKAKDRDQARQMATDNVRAQDDAASKRLEEFKNNFAISRLTSSKSKQEAFERNLAARTEQVKAQNPGMSDGDAKTEARRQIAVEYREKQKENKASKPMSEKKRRIKEAVSYFKHSDTGKLITQQIIPSMVSTGVGVFVGAGSFGVGGNAIQSIMLGNATTRGTEEFFKTSSKTLSSEVAMMAHGAGAMTTEDLQGIIGEVVGNADEFSDQEAVQEKLNELFNEIKTMVDGLTDQEQSKLQGNIRNIITKTMTENPSATNQDIMNAISNNATTMGLLAKGGIQSLDEVQGPLNDAIDYQRKAKIFSNLSTVSDWGLDPRVMMGESVNQFETLYPQGGPTGTPTGGADIPSDDSDDSTQPPPPGNDNSGGDLDDDNDSDDSSSGGAGASGGSGEPVVIDYDKDIPEQVASALDDAQDEVRQEVENVMADYKREVDAGLSHDEAKQRILEQDFEALQTDTQALVKALLHEQKLCKELTESNMNLQNLLARYRKNNGGGQ